MLLPAIDPKREKPLYEQIYAHFKAEIEAGVVAAGEKLPSRRRLARELRVSESTADAAYMQLLAEGYIFAKE